MALELFLDMISPPCRAVYIFAKTNDLPVSFRIISLLKGEHRNEEFVKVCPLGKLPCLKDGGFSMGESIPMMEYMAAKYNTADHWFPKDLQKRARANQFLSWQHMTIRTAASSMFWLKLMAPLVFKLEVPKDKMAAALEEMNFHLDTIENVFLQEGGFIAGDQVSVADLVAMEPILQLVHTGLDILNARPKLSAWKERVEQTVGKELYDETQKVLRGTQEMVKTIDASKMEAFRPRVLKLIS